MIPSGLCCAAPKREPNSREDGQKLKLREGHPWWDVLKGKAGERLCNVVMPHYLQRVFWFCGKGRVISQISVIDSCRLKQDDQLFLLAFLKVTYTEYDPEIYLIPLTWLSSEQLQAMTDRHPLATITALSLGDVEGVLCDAIYLEEFRGLLLELMSGRAKVHGANGSELVGMQRRRRDENLPAQDGIVSQQGCGCRAEQQQHYVW